MVPRKKKQKRGGPHHLPLEGNDGIQRPEAERTFLVLWEGRWRRKLPSTLREGRKKIRPPGRRDRKKEGSPLLYLPKEKREKLSLLRNRSIKGSLSGVKKNRLISIERAAHGLVGQMKKSGMIQERGKTSLSFSPKRNSGLAGTAEGERGKGESMLPGLRKGTRIFTTSQKETRCFWRTKLGRGEKKGRSP